MSAVAAPAVHPAEALRDRILDAAIRLNDFATFDGLCAAGGLPGAGIRSLETLADELDALANVYGVEVDDDLISDNIRDACRAQIRQDGRIGDEVRVNYGGPGSAPKRSFHGLGVVIVRDGLAVRAELLPASIDLTRREASYSVEVSEF